MRSRCIALTSFLLGAVVASHPVGAGKAAEVRARAAELLNQGVSAHNRGEHAEAVERLQQAAEIALNSFRTYYYLGLALSGDRRYADALDALGVALDLDPNHLRSLVALGDAHLELGDVNAARAAYYRALKQRPAHAPALDGLGRSHESLADEAKAIGFYRRAILGSKGFAPAYSHLGDLYLEQDRLEEAVRLLEEAIAVRPDYALGMNRLALAYGRLGLLGEAVAMIHEAIDLDPEEARHPTTLGLLQLEQGFIGAAEGSFREALQLEPGMAEARLGLARASRRRGHYGRALEQIDATLEDERVGAEMVLRLRGFRATVAAEREDLEGILQNIYDGGATPDDLARLARIYVRRGLWGPAAALERRSPSSPEQSERLAYLLFRAGRFREAQAIYEELAREDERTELKINNGVTLAMLGDDESAVRAYNDVLASEPNHRLARLYLGNALLRMGREQEAASTYRLFLDRGREGESAERVRRILKRIAPDLLPPESDSVLPEEDAERGPALEEDDQG